MKVHSLTAARDMVGHPDNVAIIDKALADAATAAPGDLPPAPDFNEYKEEFRNEFRAVFRQGWAACLASNAGGAIPEGFVIVPRKPTKEQWSAGIDAWNYVHGTTDGEDELPNVIYRAMIGAAPSNNSPVGAKESK